ncbi:MAG TPA: hypothetical protein VF682_16690 [Pseudomonas sp.]|jgi:hypothetical protein
MSHPEIVSEGSRDLLHSLNIATAQMMSIAIGDVGSCEWRAARSRQEQAFARLHCYINQETTIKVKEPRLDELCNA